MLLVIYLFVVFGKYYCYIIAMFFFSLSIFCLLLGDIFVFICIPRLVPYRSCHSATLRKREHEILRDETFMTLLEPIAPEILVIISSGGMAEWRTGESVASLIVTRPDWCNFREFCVLETDVCRLERNLFPSASGVGGIGSLGTRRGSIVCTYLHSGHAKHKPQTTNHSELLLSLFAQFRR